MSKKNAEYWAERFKDLEKAQNEMAAKTVKSINASYDRAIHQVQKEIDAWYQRFAKNNQITYAEARKRLNSKELKELQWDVKEYIKYGKDNELNQQWIKELENASAKVHISRLQALELNIRQAVEKVTADQENKTAAVLSDVYETGYYHTAYEIAKGLQIGSDIGRLDERAINNILHKPWAPDGKNFSDRIWENKNKLLNTIHQELSQNIMTGADPQKAIDAISKKMMTSKYNAGRLVMTEEAYFNSLSQGDMFKELDVEKYEIVATLDSHTSEICQDMDGKVFPMSEYESGVTAPPFHVYCRSTTAPWFPEDYGVKGERAARDTDDDKTYHIPADITYKQWFEKYVKSSPIEGIREPIDVNKLEPDKIRDTVLDREQQIIDMIGEGTAKSTMIREGNGWMRAMREFHRAVDADGIPEILSDEEYDAIETPVLYRGIAKQSGLRADIKSTSTVREMADEFFTKDSPFPSRGIYGDGVAYCSPSYKKIAWNYATNHGQNKHGGAIIEFKLKPDAKVIQYEDAVAIFDEMKQQGGSKLLFARQRRTNHEVGKLMNALGYDAIIKHNGDHTGKDFYVILNRGALVTKENYVKML